MKSVAFGLSRSEKAGSFGHQRRESGDVFVVLDAGQDARHVVILGLSRMWMSSLERFNLKELLASTLLREIV